MIQISKYFYHIPTNQKLSKCCTVCDQSRKRKLRKLSKHKHKSWSCSRKHGTAYRCSGCSESRRKHLDLNQTWSALQPQNSNAKQSGIRERFPPRIHRELGTQRRGRRHGHTDNLTMQQLIQTSGQHVAPRMPRIRYGIRNVEMYMYDGNRRSVGTASSSMRRCPGS
jgi:hypothetical protein